MARAVSRKRPTRPEIIQGLGHILPQGQDLAPLQGSFLDPFQGTHRREMTGK